ncbi:hypothetical protein GYA49_00960 [Candidatus Beckwithbacteria bacterium]|nr:hypothetical protein [Candidatus Beckwithbacteria bacterium]
MMGPDQVAERRPKAGIEEVIARWNEAFETSQRNHRGEEGCDVIAMAEALTQCPDAILILNDLI